MVTTMDEGQDVDRMNEKENRKGAVKTCCKKAIKFAFSHIGLCGMVIAYAVAGGFIFEHLEKTNERQECIKAMNKYNPMENDTTIKMWEVAKIFCEDASDEETESNAQKEIQKLLVKFRDDVLELGYDGKDCLNMGNDGGPGYQWSFPGALLFSVTVITTIGYGNIAPKTFWGRLVCIAYATLGIPLMLLCLANIGDVMADIFRYVYSKICCCGCCRRKNRKSEQTEQNTDGSHEAWRESYSKGQKGGPPQVVDDPDDDDDEDAEERISVPLTITMAVIAFYIFCGAMLFGIWDGLTPLDASYFCFVTVSTIGFGDIVPGSANFETKMDQYKMILSSIYMVFGLALLSMCFSLIQEEIATKFKWVGEKLGIIEKENAIEDEDDDDDDEDNESQHEQDLDGSLPQKVCKE